MPDRVIRNELLTSDRWASLPTDTHRLVFMGLVLISDDYGNIEGGPRRLFRWMHTFTQIKSETDAIKLMSDLQDSDMALRYESGGKEYWHLTRFRNSRRYWSRKYPKSPYQEQENETKQWNTKKTSADLRQGERSTAEGVGVGVGELLTRTRTTRASGDKLNGDTPEAKATRLSTWASYSTAYFNRYGTEPLRNAQSNSLIAKFCQSVASADAPAIAAFYVAHNKYSYTNSKHDLKLMVACAPALHTDWKTGQQSTDSQARKLDQGQAQGSVWAKLKAEGKP